MTKALKKLIVQILKGSKQNDRTEPPQTQPQIQKMC